MKTGAVILAGGKSRRMGGKSKADMTVNGLTVIERLVKELSFFDELLISAEKGIGYEKFCRVIPDIYKDCGPIGGIYSALSDCDSDRLFVTACDMPLIKSDTVKRLCEYDGYDVIAVKNGEKIEPLFAIYKKEAAEYMKECILSSRLAVRNIYEGLDVKIVDIEEITDDKKEFFNMNTPEDYFRLTGKTVLMEEKA